MIRDYNKDHCWQYDIRLNNLEEDLILAGLTADDVNNLNIADFVLQHEEKEICYEEVKSFIERHEWLGRMSLYPTNIFTARYNGILAGVVIMDMPSVFSKMLGDETRKIERLISRGGMYQLVAKKFGKFFNYVCHKMDGKKHQISFVCGVFGY